MEYAVYNPKNRPVDELPYIMGFANGSFGSDIIGVAIAEDGTGLGSHVSSSVGFSVGDLGLTPNSWRKDRQETYNEHYPDGWRADWVEANDPRLLKAIEANKKLREAAEQAEA